MTDDLLAHNGHLAQVLGLHVGHFTHPDRPTGCSVVLCPQGATAGVDVRGAAPGTRETDLLHPSHLVQHVHGITLAGGSAWGLGGYFIFQNTDSTYQEENHDNL